MKHKQVKTKRALVGLSGGVDSAVSAWLLLQQGYEVEGVFMKNWSSTKGLKYDECPWLQDRQEALRVAAFLRIPLHTVDFEKQYEKEVLGYFFREYQAGRTPNPDVMCNKEIKFKLLYDWAIKRGFDFLATGHYAQIKNQKSKIKNCTLLRSKDEFKDQTYFIYNIARSQLPHLLFPIGGMKKTEVKKLAEKIRLPNAKRKESMGLCFVGKVRLKEFLEQKVRPQPGKIIDQDGNVIGEHQGLYTYTIGQRQGIRVDSGGPYYVTKKDIKSNTLFVTTDPNDPKLQTKELALSSMHWITEPKSLPVKLKARFRHQQTLQSVVIKKAPSGEYVATFSKPQLAVASGQSLVLYRDKECLGGGVIG